MKTILSIWHTGRKGKTETLRAFANLLLTTYSAIRPIYPEVARVPLNGDFRLVVEINKKIIGVESQGDPGTNLQNRLIDLVDNYNCELILSASRTRGKTVAAIDNLFHSRGFDTIWTSTYQIANEDQHDRVNQLKAKHILELLQLQGLL
jgi:hypothetical protein